LKIPKQIKAFGRTYTIVRDNNVTDRMECWGYLDAMRDVIVLKERNSEFTLGNEKQVFLHELMHVVDSNFHIGLTEEQIQTLSVGLVTILTDNNLDFSQE
jgi:hypothetical protein